MESQYNIGLTYYQECQWIAAIKQYGMSIMDRSLLSKDQKIELIKIAQEAQS